MDKIRILVVDDEASILKSIVFGSLENDVQAYFAKDEEECLNALESIQVDWILMDGSLEDNVWGKDIVYRLRAGGCQIPICMFSSCEDMNGEGLNAGANTSIRKKEVIPTPSKLTEHLATFSQS